MAKCSSCTSNIPCKRHMKKSKASNWYVPNVALPPPYGFTFATDRPDEVEVCKQKTYSFAESNLGNNIFIGTEVGVRHRIIVKDNNNSIKLDATLTVGTAISISDISIGGLDMIVEWFEDDAIVTIEPNKILPLSSGVMSHFVEYNGVWSVNTDDTFIQRWQVDFIYDPPVSIAMQPDSLWVDNGCSIDFAAQNNIDERAIETATQIDYVGVSPVSTELTPISGVPTNQNYTSNPIISTTNIVIGIGNFAPRYTVKSQGNQGGYVKVEWEAEVDFIPAGQQRSYVISDGVIVKTTAYIVDPNTGVINPAHVSIDFATGYLLPPRISAVNFTGAISSLPAFSTPAEFPNENGIEIARRFQFTMPPNNFTAVVEFRDIEVLDFDFQNPICSDGAADNTAVVTIRDRQSKVLATQTTPSKRATLTATKGLKTAAQPQIGSDSGYAFQLDTTKIHESVFLVADVNQKPIDAYALPYGRNLDFSTTGIISPADGEHIFSFFTPYFSYSFGANSNADDNCFGLYFDGRSGGATVGVGYPTPSFSMSANLDTKLGFCIKKGEEAKLYANSTVYNYPNVSSFLGVFYKPGGVFRTVYIFQNNRAGIGSLYRLLTTEALTANEMTVFESKLVTKYSL